MLRFSYAEIDISNRVHINENVLYMDNNIWSKCKLFLPERNIRQSCIINMIPVKDAGGELIAYGYQDNEANRELRMLRELRENEQALQFTDIFSEYKEVLILGCNELAVTFAEYLKELGVDVSVIGQYWNYYGYENCDQNNLLGGGKELIVYAEGIPLQNQGLYQTVIRSVSPEFECIDRIYEANVLEGRICDTIGDFDEFIRRLNDEPEIVILGDDREAQDTYDLLIAHGIDICCFAVPEESDRILLGKKVISIEEALQCFRRPVFLNYRDVHGALGEEWTEYFDYRGYERNKQYFLVRDYTDIPTSNLVHVLHGKNVILTGDTILSRMLSDYLNLIENSEITIRYIPLSEKVSAGKDDILCLVVPNYIVEFEEKTEKSRILNRKLSEMGFVGYTEYFVCSRCFALIDLYLNKDAKKYTVSRLLPKGFLLGRIPGQSGNYFFRGIMDGHPEILLIPYSYLNQNMFYYCVRLANFASDKVLQSFWQMYDSEAGSKERDFPNPEIFEKTVKNLLNLKERFTSQELFVLFHIAYAEMMSGRQISDISNVVIYWEPHFENRDEFPFYALWLEDRKVNGNTIAIRRNHIVRVGSVCSRIAAGRPGNRNNIYTTIFGDESGQEEINLKYQYWAEHKMRFEDIKTRPREKLMEVCSFLDIAWSDCMLKTTYGDKPLIHCGSVDFDLKPVFNKYDDYLSEFDRFRISIACSPYQKRYGYTYDNCLKFSRRELQELFLKPFLFDIISISGNEIQEDCQDRYEWIIWQLWNVRKHMVLGDVHPEFDRFDLEQTAKQSMDEYNQNEINKSMEYIKNHDKLILYGTGNDCLGLLKLIDERVKEKVLYSDKKAEEKSYIFQGKNVLAPKELCHVYEDYNILVTSSQYRRDIEYEFEKMGIDSSRVHYSRAEFREDDK